MMRSLRALCVFLALFIPACGVQNPFDPLPPNQVLDLADTRVILCATEIPGTWEDGFDIAIISNWAALKKRVTILRVDGNNEQLGEPVLRKTVSGNDTQQFDGFFIHQGTRIFIGVECAEGFSDWRPCNDGNGFFNLSKSLASRPLDGVVVETDGFDREVQLEEREVNGGFYIQATPRFATPGEAAMCPQRVNGH